MEIVLELVAQLIGFLFEGLIQVVFEVLFEAGSHTAHKRGVRQFSAVYSAIGCVLLGVVCGAMSAVLLPEIAIESVTLQTAYLAFMPFVVAGVMGLLGAWRRRRGEPLLKLDRFIYSYLFALAMALTRHAIVT